MNIISPERHSIWTFTKRNVRDAALLYFHPFGQVGDWARNKGIENLKKRGLNWLIRVALGKDFHIASTNETAAHWSHRRRQDRLYGENIDCTGTSIAKIIQDRRDVTSLLPFLPVSPHSLPFPFNFIVGSHAVDAQLVFGYVASQDFTMYPLLMPGSIVLIDENRNRVVEGKWRSEYERPIYFVETRDGFVCSWCSLRRDDIVLQPHPLSPIPVRILRHPQEAQVIGQVVACAMSIGDAGFSGSGQLDN